MSLIHNIITKIPLDISKLNTFISNIENAVVQDRGNGLFYFWIEGKSTRGFDITIDGETIEVRNTMMSNIHDYELTNKVIVEILKLTDGVLTDEDREQIDAFSLIDSDLIAETELQDCETIQIITKEPGTITIYGPKRSVHFGSRMHKRFRKYKGKRLKEKMFDLILKVNYEIPDFWDGNVMEWGDSDEEKLIMKLLTNEMDCIIDQYDYILLDTLEEIPLMISNIILNKILPSNWTLVDDFTVVAPVLSDKEWQKLLKRAKKYDQYDAVMGGERT